MNRTRIKPEQKEKWLNRTNNEPKQPDEGVNKEKLAKTGRREK